MHVPSIPVRVSNHNKKKNEIFFSSSKPLIWILWRAAGISLDLGFAPSITSLHTEQLHLYVKSTWSKQARCFWTRRIKPAATDPVGQLLTTLSAHADTKSSFHANNFKYLWPRSNPCSPQIMRLERQVTPRRVTTVFLTRASICIFSFP